MGILPVNDWRFWHNISKTKLLACWTINRTGGKKAPLSSADCNIWLPISRLLAQNNFWIARQPAAIAIIFLKLKFFGEISLVLWLLIKGVIDAKWWKEQTCEQRV
jgi:hypothetical protein